MEAAENRASLLRGIGLVLLGVGGLLAGALTPALGALVSDFSIHTVVAVAISAATIAVVILPRPAAEFVFALGLALLGAVIISSGILSVTIWLAPVAMLCLMVGFAIRIFTH